MFTQLIDMSNENITFSEQDVLVRTKVTEVLLSVDFSYCWINLEVLKYSLEQYIGFVVRQAFNYCCSLHQVWREAENLSAYIGFGSLRSVKSVKIKSKASNYF